MWTILWLPVSTFNWLIMKTNLYYKNYQKQKSLDHPRLFCLIQQLNCLAVIKEPNIHYPVIYEGNFGFFVGVFCVIFHQVFVVPHLHLYWF